MKSENEIIQYVLKNAKVTRIAMSLDNNPYIVPMNFGFDGNNLYLHTGEFGKKIDILKKNDKVCFEMDINHELVESSEACKWSMRFLSIIGYGKAIFLDEISQKIKALGLIMQQYSNTDNWNFNEEDINKVNIIKINIESISGREKK